LFGFNESEILLYQENIQQHLSNFWLSSCFNYFVGELSLRQLAIITTGNSWHQWVTYTRKTWKLCRHQPWNYVLRIPTCVTRIPQRHRQTDKEIGGQTDNGQLACGNTVLCVASHDSNWLMLYWLAQGCSEIWTVNISIYICIFQVSLVLAWVSHLVQ